MKNTRTIDEPPRLARDAAAPPPPRLRWLGSAILRGCNVHHQRTVLCMDLDLGPLHGRSSALAGPGFAERFIARFFNAAQTPPTAADERAFLDALHSARGVPLQEVLLQAIVAVERRLAFARNDFVPLGMAGVEPLPAQRQPSQVRLVWESARPAQSRVVAKLALAGLLALLPAALRGPAAAESTDFDAALELLLQRARRRRAPLSTAVIALAAHARGIPCASLGGPHLQLGHGAAQRMFYSSVPDEMPLSAARLSRDKRRCTQRLALLGLPVTRQVVVASAAQAVAAAGKLGYPVVVKPRKGRQGAGVSVGLARDDEVAAAFELASAKGARVLVETFVQGSTYRLLVIGGRFVAATEISVPTVVGDGKQRIEELIQELNRDPMRNGVCLTQVRIDADLRACLARGGRKLADVPQRGREVALRTAANASLGGVSTDVTDRVHVSQRELAERAAQAIGLSVAGIDVISRDITLPCTEADTRIIEVNARPGVDLHVYPRHGRARDVGGAMVAHEFPPGSDGRLTTALVLGRRGARAVARELEVRLEARGQTTGLVVRNAARADGDQPPPLQTPQPPQPLQPLHKAVAAIQHDPRMQALVVATTPRLAVARGLALECADVATLLAGEGADDAAEDAQAAALALRAVRRGLVVEAENAAALRVLQAAMETGTLERTRLILVGTQRGDPLVEAHVAAGGTAVLSLADPLGERIVVLWRDNGAPQRRDAEATDAAGRGKRVTRARLHAAALAWALELPLWIRPEPAGRESVVAPRRRAAGKK